MSCSTYFARITPESRSRLSVIGVAAGCCLAGLISIAVLPVHGFWRTLLAAAWLLSSGVGVWRYQQAITPALGYEIRSDGSVRVLAAGGRSFAARLAAGTTVIANLAWLRFESPGRRPWGELVVRPSGADKQLKNKDWRRLQVICRHLPAC